MIKPTAEEEDIQHSAGSGSHSEHCCFTSIMYICTNVETVYRGKAMISDSCGAVEHYR